MLSHQVAAASHDPPTKTDAGMEQIGEYLVRRLIGEGGMGKVYEAEERLSKRRVALKVLREELAKSEQARGLFLNEMQILAHLEHPNIVRSLASVEAGGKLVMVLEYLDGRTLRELTNEKERLGWEEAAYVVACVARALEGAHGQRPPVIHRDLKPENIMVLAGGSVKVMDFGIAKLVQELNKTNTQSVGTLQYMSPEQIDAQPIDQRTDLYCLGLVFYELLAGRPPFQSSSPRTLLNLQCTEAPPPLDEAVRAGLPKGIERLVFQLLEKDPAARPPAAADVVERLEQFLPDKAFGDLGARAAGASSDRIPTPRVPSTTRQDTMPSAQETPRKAEARQLEKAAEKGPSKPVERKDTIALVDAAGGARQLSTRMSLIIIVALMLVSGLATYFWRASQLHPTPDDESSSAEK
jgi:eukaryotic-like serine/threonine-protein kinase